ncbi:Minor extracellular protease vpr OS=Bacillus subtilis (strain 168) GN=vpr PE=1 SV=1 [Rhizoctonia solani AG-1 IB]|uniref:Minor extracellular protease vpr n=1 Tax=Thanatephorus cucumeris (strain AG1-IB / isolate 7/3/14) TaxID=1108050 RepID=A0A0B7FB83_THACB|nr:Minor extracellular protease vpr OS=Bacillus subtilis (strain 168) GN=vpr PE=1 SV=1 [Rhizoctonia solani AG-1 IB]
MRVFAAAATAAAAAQLVTAAVDLKSVKHTSTANIVPGAYIVTLAEGSHLKRGFSSPHAELYHELDVRATDYQVSKEWNDAGLLTGAAVKLGNDADLVKLAQASGVQSITPVYLHPGPKPVSKTVVGTSNSTAAKDVFSTHVMTGVDKLHADGYYGKGIKIGIIDTGIDYTHPALGGKFGPGNKVIGGYDFVGDAYTGRDGTPPPSPDNDPLDQCNGHGTHVAGIIGADPVNPYNISGVAYESSINAYRVFGCDGSVPDDILIDSLLRAYKDGNDVITLSLGGADGWTEAVSGVVASKIADAGRIVTIAAGNDGQYGSWYTSGPGTGLSVISVGSIDNTVATVQNAVVSSGREIPYLGLATLPIPAGLTLYATSTDTTVADDACNPLPATTPDLSNKLVIIRRGTCTFVSKLDNAAKFGAKYFLIYDNKDQTLSSIATGNYIGALISQQDGVFLVKEGVPQNLTVSFPNNPATIPVPGGGLMSSFSTYGPTNDMYFKPAVSAPGGNILSTYPVPLGAYAILSGTSMATPFVAGSAALLFQLRGKTAATAKVARTLFENTAIPVQQTTANTSLLETASHQGAGLIQVYDAIHASGILTPAELLLNDTANFKGTQILKITNNGKKPVTYTFSHIPAGTAPTIDGIEPITGPVSLVNSPATVSIVPNQLTVPAGFTLPVVASIKAPTGLDAKTFPVYSGFIKAKGSDGSSLQSTYLGVAASLKNAKILDNTDAYFGLALIDAKTNVTTNQRRSIDTRGEVDVRSLSLPHSTINKRSIWSWLFPWLNQGSGTFNKVPLIGVLYQEDYISRNSAGATSDTNGYSAYQITQFANGTAIPDGSYKILLRALKITGDPIKEEDYEVWTSPEIDVKRV